MASTRFSRSPAVAWGGGQDALGAAPPRPGAARHFRTAGPQPGRGRNVPAPLCRTRPSPGRPVLATWATRVPRGGRRRPRAARGGRGPRRCRRDRRPSRQSTLFGRGDLQAGGARRLPGLDRAGTDGGDDAAGEPGVDHHRHLHGAGVALRPPAVRPPSSRAAKGGSEPLRAGRSLPAARKRPSSPSTGASSKRSTRNIRSPSSAAVLSRPTRYQAVNSKGEPVWLHLAAPAPVTEARRAPCHAPPRATGRGPAATAAPLSAARPGSGTSPVAPSLATASRPARAAKLHGGDGEAQRPLLGRARGGARAGSSPRDGCGSRAAPRPPMARR